MRILGLDPGLASPGLVIMDISESQCSVLALQLDHSRTVVEQLRAFATDYAVELLAVERQVCDRLALGWVQMLSAELDVPYREVTPYGTLTRGTSRSRINSKRRGMKLCHHMGATLRTHDDCDALLAALSGWLMMRGVTPTKAALEAAAMAINVSGCAYVAISRSSGTSDGDSGGGGAENAGRAE